MGDNLASIKRNISSYWQITVLLFKHPLEGTALCCLSCLLWRVPVARNIIQGNLHEIASDSRRCEKKEQQRNNIVAVVPAASANWSTGPDNWSKMGGAKGRRGSLWAALSSVWIPGSPPPHEYTTTLDRDRRRISGRSWSRQKQTGLVGFGFWAGHVRFGRPIAEWRVISIYRSYITFFTISFNYALKNRTKFCKKAIFGATTQCNNWFISSVKKATQWNVGL